MNNAIVKIADIRVSEHRRAADPEKVAALAGSIHRLGLLQALHNAMNRVADLSRLDAQG